jgi:cytochrome c
MKHMTILACALFLLAATAPELVAADADHGKELFGQCSICHNVDKPDKKIGPSLMGLFKKQAMQNGKAPTEQNVTAVITDGGNGMPAYKDILTDEEKADMIAYLKTL